MNNSVVTSHQLNQVTHTHTHTQTHARNKLLLAIPAGLMAVRGCFCLQFERELQNWQGSKQPGDPMALAEKRLSFAA